MPPRTNGYVVGLRMGNKVFKSQSILTFKFKIEMIEDYSSWFIWDYKFKVEMIEDTFHWCII